MRAVRPWTPRCRHICVLTKTYLCPNRNISVSEQRHICVLTEPYLAPALTFFLSLSLSRARSLTNAPVLETRCDDHMMALPALVLALGARQGLPICV